MTGRQWVVLLLLVGVGVMGVVLWRALLPPPWYVVGRQVTDTASMDAAANRFEDGLVELGNFAGAGLASEARRTRGESSSPTSGEPERRTFVWTLDGSEANAFLRRWAVLHRGEAGLAGFLAGKAEPVVAVRDGRVVGSLRVPGVLGLRPVVSVAFRPECVGAGDGSDASEGGLRWSVERCWVGRMPVPAFIGRRMLERAAGPVREGLSRWQADARLDARGRGNVPMALASGAQMLLAVLEGRAGPDVLFVPVGERHSAPVRVVGVDATADGVGLRLTLELVPEVARELAARRVRGEASGIR